MMKKQEKNKKKKDETKKRENKKTNETYQREMIAIDALVSVSLSNGVMNLIKWIFWQVDTS